MPEVFAVEFKCKNCGDVWEETFEPQVTVEDSRMGRVMVWDTTCNEFGTQACDCCYNVECPTCELKKPVRVTDRHPIGEESEEEAEA